MKNKILTFSIAAYNVEKFINKCVSSILLCKHRSDIEILIVDDGSLDDTALIAGKYEKKYPDIVRLIRKQNGGHGSTINIGIEEARGKYFKAVDGDDWVNNSDTDVLIEKLKEEDSDVVLCNYLSYFDDGEIKKDKFNKVEEGKQYTLEALSDILDWMNYHSVVYKTELLKKNKIHLDENCFYVDTEFMAFPVPYINSVRYYDLYVYCYRRDNEGQSVSENSRIKNILHSKKVAVKLLKYLKTYEKKVSPEKKRYLQGGVAGHCMWHFRGLTFFAPDEEKRIELIAFDRYVKRMSPEVFRLMTIPATNRSAGDANIIKHIRKFNYITFNVYGIYRKFKAATKNLLKKV